MVRKSDTATIMVNYETLKQVDTLFTIFNKILKGIISGILDKLI